MQQQGGAGDRLLGQQTVPQVARPLSGLSEPMTAQDTALEPRSQGEVILLAFFAPGRSLGKEEVM
jgi:hypothetical protein